MNEKKRRRSLRQAEIRSFAERSDRIERMLARAVLWLAILLLLFQTALQFPEIRRQLTTTDRLEGVPYAKDSR